ncbi:hypothetical protein BJ546DRAFT_601037 [Cryomyces antarcticus]
MAMNVCWNPHTTTQHATTAGPVCQITIENEEEVLHYEPEYKVLICREHGYSVRNLHDHLRDQHATNIKERRAIVEKYAQYELLEPRNVPLPPPLGSPIEGLGKPVEAFLCEEEECGFVSTNHSVIRKHCNTKHDWKWKKEDPEYWTKVKAQTFFTGGGFRRYFVVHAAEDHSIAVALGQEDKDNAAAIKRE